MLCSMFSQSPQRNRLGFSTSRSLIRPHSGRPAGRAAHGVDIGEIRLDVHIVRVFVVCQLSQKAR